VIDEPLTAFLLGPEGLKREQPLGHSTVFNVDTVVKVTLGLEIRVIVDSKHSLSGFRG
jgi:hypothetical protein